MKIKRCQIRNFRGLEDVELVFQEDTCLIAGPNAIGKSTVLEAIRLNRALLLNRYPSEGQTVLHALGATTNPNQIMLRGGYFDFSAIAQDPDSNILVRMEVQLESHELPKINGSLQQLALDFLRGNLGSQIQQDQASMTQFLSSGEGRERLSEAETQISSFVSGLNTSDLLVLAVEISPTGQIRGLEAAAQIVCGFLDRSLPPQVGVNLPRLVPC